MATPFFYHPDFAAYDFGPSHPFQGSRFERFMRELEARFPSVYAELEVRRPARAENELLELVHARPYIARVGALEKRRGFLSPDTQLLPGSVDAARLIVGASAAAAEACLQGGLAIGFGGLHHAGPDYGEGFCIFNDVAVAAAALLRRGYSRIVILDTDAHQGNGTMDIFYEDPRVLFVSIHQDPRTLYPGRGFVDEIGRGPGEVIIRNGGCDPLYTDTLTNLGLTLDELTALVRRITEKASALRVPLLDLFLSGYGPYVTEGWLAILRGILGESFELSIPEKPKRISRDARAGIEKMTTEMLIELKRHLRPYWKIF
jgi:acetoin utilization deacetylase AcuC-like enzyme